MIFLYLIYHHAANAFLDIYFIMGRFKPHEQGFF